MKENNIPRFKTLAEEKEYWESKSICNTDVEGEINEPVSTKRRSSFLSVRLSGDELTQLHDEASKFNMGPSTFARALLLAFIQSEKRPREEISLQKVIQVVDQKTSPQFREKAARLMEEISLGGSQKPSVLVIDPGQQKEMYEMGQKLVEMLFEVVGYKLVRSTENNADIAKPESHAQENTDYAKI
jgi:hypothetical protein